MIIAIGCDHAGLPLKPRIVQELEALGHVVLDCGAFALDPQDDYPPPCITAAARAVADPGSLCVVIGGSGNGEQIAANKVPRVPGTAVFLTRTEGGVPPVMVCV